MAHSLFAHTIATCLDKHWQVHLRCAGAACGRLVTWRADRLRALPRAMTLAALARAAECTACGHVGALAWPSQDHGSTRAADYARLDAEAAARSP